MRRLWAQRLHGCCACFTGLGHSADSKCCGCNVSAYASALPSHFCCVLCQLPLPLSQAASHNSTTSRSSRTLPLLQIIHINLTSDKPVPAVAGTELVFTYGVDWVLTNLPFSDRFVRYLDSGFFEHKVSALPRLPNRFPLACYCKNGSTWQRREQEHPWQRCIGQQRQQQWQAAAAAGGSGGSGSDGGSGASGGGGYAGAAPAAAVPSGNDSSSGSDNNCGGGRGGGSGGSDGGSRMVPEVSLVMAAGMQSQQCSQCGPSQHQGQQL